MATSEGEGNDLENSQTAKLFGKWCKSSYCTLFKEEGGGGGERVFKVYTQNKVS